MTYSVRIERIGEAGVPKGVPVLLDAATEPDAVVLALREVGAHGSQRVATVLSDSGAIVLIYAGRASREAS